eukprot:TRINITY_DN731_c0_g2_i1.p1 TRINITY_DN731_c0_g2~~TRINITY_DN731_c0_g2_i1.p1  ORF type:complete len:1157 (+),score=104.87 TRINITY_DN731_c0_g2_i1:205-3675(+)
MTFSCLQQFSQALSTFLCFSFIIAQVLGFNSSELAELGLQAGNKRFPPWAHFHFDDYRQLNSRDPENIFFEAANHGLSVEESNFQWDEIKRCQVNPPKALGTFVQVKGTQFVYDEQPFYFIGMNGYHLIREELEDRAYNVEDTFERAKNIGMQVVRLWAFSDNLRKDLFTWNQQTFKALDAVILKARKYDFKVVLALANYWEEFNGTDAYVSMVHGTIANYTVEEFYQNRDVKLAYKAHVCKVINRINFYTGVRYRDDPTIMAWNLMNEARCPGCNGQAHHKDIPGGLVAEWIDEMAAFVKSIDPNHLLTTGVEGFFGKSSPQHVLGSNPDTWSICTGTDFRLMHRSDDIDYSVMHVYIAYKSFNFDANTYCDMECKLAWVTNYVWQHFEEAMNALNKPLVIEEFGVSVLRTYQLPSGEERYYNRNDRTEFFKRILGVFLSSAKNGGAGAGAMVWTAAVNQHTDYDGLTVYLDNQGAPAFESQDIIEWEPVPTLGHFQKEAYLLSCSIKEYNKSWIPTPLHVSDQIQVQQIYGDNEVEVFQSTSKQLQDAGLFVDLNKDRIPQLPWNFTDGNVLDLNDLENGIVQAFASRSIINDDLFEEFYRDFLPERLYDYNYEDQQLYLQQSYSTSGQAAPPKSQLPDQDTNESPRERLVNAKDASQDDRTSDSNDMLQHIIELAKQEYQQNQSYEDKQGMPPPPAPFSPTSPPPQLSPLPYPSPPNPPAPIPPSVPVPAPTPSVEFATSPTRNSTSTPAPALNQPPQSYQQYEAESNAPLLDESSTPTTETISDNVIDNINYTELVQSSTTSSLTTVQESSDALSPQPGQIFTVSLPDLQIELNIFQNPSEQGAVAGSSNSTIEYSRTSVEKPKLETQQVTSQPPPSPLPFSNNSQLYESPQSTIQEQNQYDKYIPLEYENNNNDNSSTAHNPYELGYQQQSFYGYEQSSGYSYSYSSNLPEIEQPRQINDNYEYSGDYQHGYELKQPEMEYQNDHAENQGYERVEDDKGTNQTHNQYLLEDEVEGVVQAQSYDDNYNGKSGNGSYFESGDIMNMSAIPAYTLSQGECNHKDNANYKGQVLNSSSANSEDMCCAACWDLPQCNVYVYCPKPFGCHYDGQIFPHNLCDLKYQQTVLEGSYPEVWVEGPSTHFSSGYIKFKGQT